MCRLRGAEMGRVVISIFGGCMLLPTLMALAQQTLPDAPSASTPASWKPTTRMYSPPTQGERFKTYVRHTFSISSVLEAGVRGGIDQARDNPSQWPEGAQG